MLPRVCKFSAAATEIIERELWLCVVAETNARIRIEAETRLVVRERIPRTGLRREDVALEGEGLAIPAVQREGSARGGLGGLRPPDTQEARADEGERLR